jgi:hypothetical protein
MTWLIDVTDQRFKISVNAAVIDHIGRTNPFAHSDLGQKLIELGRALPGAVAYCPDYRACAYVLLHDADNRIFAFAGGMLDLSFRLSPALHGEALDEGHGRPSPIGGEWFDFPVFRMGAARASEAQLSRYCAAAQHHVATLPL